MHVIIHQVRDKAAFVDNRESAPETYHDNG